MEILRFLLSFFENEYEGGKFKPIIEALKNDNFDLNSIIKNFNPSDFAPIIATFFNGNEKKPSEGVLPAGG